jgi:hypothetical protein
MKKCPNCYQTYADESLNFCLNCGGTLMQVHDDAPPTVFMNEVRPTSPSNWSTNAPFNPPNYEPIAPWQNQPLGQNPPFMAAGQFEGQDKTLPTVSLVLGILSIVLFFCCYAGVPFGIGALITGFLGFNNTNKNPMQFGGRGFAIAGMIMGAISFIGLILMLLITAITR